jgi:hypothetical protein
MIMIYLVAVVVAALGVTGIIAGGADDSPGLQLIGLLLVIGAVVLVVRAARRRVRPAPE